MAVSADPALPFIPFPQSGVFSGTVSRKEKAAAEADKPQHGDFRRTPASARDWTGDRGKDLADAQIVRRVQERAAIGEAGSCCTQAARQTIREIPSDRAGISDHCASVRSQ